MVEQCFCKAKVVGSSPSAGSVGTRPNVPKQFGTGGERHFCKVDVAGSNPPAGSIFPLPLL